MLNKMKIALASSIVIASMAATGAQAATATGQAEVDIVAPVTITAGNKLDFGVVAVGTTGGTVAIPNSADTRTCAAALTCVGTVSRGSFTVNATSGYTVALTVPATVSLTSGANTMSATLSPSATTLAFTGSAQTLFVGGTLTVAGSQAAGTYTGTYNVTADYQ